VRARSLLVAFGFLVLPGCTTDTDVPKFDNPLDPIVDSTLPQPESIVVLVGNNTVRLSWSLPEGRTADEFAVNRKRVDEAGNEIEPLRKVATIKTTTFEDAQARNGRIYMYSVAAGNGTRFGRASDEIEARPAAFGIVLESGANATRSNEFSVAFNVPQGTTSVQLSELEDFSDASWSPVGSMSRWSSSPGDGVKTVYARFQLDGGAESLPVSDSIRLDTQAVIRQVDFDGGEVRAPGQTIRFRVDAGEPGGSAEIDVPGLYSSLVLLDDGTAGDSADDGVYEREVAIPEGVTVNRAVVSARFTDALGNEAAELQAQRRLTVQSAPEAVELLPPEVSQAPDPPSVELRWTVSLDDDFSVYRVHRAEGEKDRVQATITAKESPSYSDGTVAEGSTYSYSIEVVSGAGLSSRSSSIQVEIPNQRPPAAVTLDPAEASSTTRLVLKWSRNMDRDFESYRVYRNSAGAVTVRDSMLFETGDQDLTFLDDQGLAENTAYYYRVYTVDRGGLSSRSNEVEGRTQNEPPPAVTLNMATDVDSVAATLSWSGSTVHDFKFYRVYRSEASGVSTASHLAAEIDNALITTYRDTGLTAGTSYHYRVYVVDDGTNPEPMSTGSNEIVVTPSTNE